MRCSAWSSLAISVSSALVLASPAVAHVTVAPPFLAAGETKTLELTAPNERDVVMSGFAVRVPAGFSIVEAPRPTIGWEGTIRGETANWSGCCLYPEQEAVFALDVTAPREPGPAQIEVRQLYPDGKHVRWSVPLTVVPADESSQQLGWTLVLAAAVLVAITAIALLAWRRARSRQEK